MLEIGIRVATVAAKLEVLRAGRLADDDEQYERSATRCADRVRVGGGVEHWLLSRTIASTAEYGNQARDRRGWQQRVPDRFVFPKEDGVTCGTRKQCSHTDDHGCRDRTDPLASAMDAPDL